MGGWMDVVMEEGLGWAGRTLHERAELAQALGRGGREANLAGQVGLCGVGGRRKWFA